MSVCINSSLNFTSTKYGHGEGPALAHQPLPTPESLGLSTCLLPLSWGGRKGAPLSGGSLLPGRPRLGAGQGAGEAPACSGSGCSSR